MDNNTVNRAKIITSFYNVNPIYPDTATKAQKEDEKRLKDRVIEEVSNSLIMMGLVKQQ